MLDERPVACANIAGPFRLPLLWRNQRKTAEETGVLFNSDAAMPDRAVSRLADLQPHDCQAIIGGAVSASLPRLTELGQ